MDAVTLHAVLVVVIILERGGLVGMQFSLGGGVGVGFRGIVSAFVNSGINQMPQS